MIEAIRVASLALAAVSAAMLLVLVARRLWLAWSERRRTRLEHQLQPLALDVIDGELDERTLLLPNESRTLAVIVERYSQRVTGGQARDNIAVFFERRGDVRRELERLGARRAWRRATAAYLLGDMASSLAVPALIAALDDHSRDVRSAATRSLGVLGASEAVPRLVECLAAGTVPRGVAGYTLLMIGQAARTPLRSLLARDEAEVRAAAAELVGFVGSLTEAPDVASLLDDPAAEVRAAAARALGRLGAEAAAPGLRDVLRDRMPFVRSAAAASLAALDDVEATGALAQMARTDEHEPALAAARALARISPAQAAVAAHAKDAGPYLRQAADMAELAR